MATIEELQNELAAMRNELQAMRAEMATPRAGEEEPRMLSRRNLLRAAPVAAVGGAIAAMSASPAAAAVGNPVLQGQANNEGTGKTTSLSGGTTVDLDGNFAGVTELTTPALAVAGGLRTDWVFTDTLTLGQTSAAALSVYPNSPDLSLGAKFTGPDLLGPHTLGSSTAVLIENRGPGLVVAVTDGVTGFEGGDPGTILTSPGVSVASDTGHAVDASSTQTVIAVQSTGTTATTDAVTIATAGKGRGLYVESTSTTNVNGTVTGVNDGNAGIGVWGEQRGTTGAGFGVVGVGGKAGRGARLSGGAANVQMLPSTASTHPTTGKAGDFFVDASARLWYCQKASSGSTAATWKQLA